MPRLGEIDLYRWIDLPPGTGECSFEYYAKHAGYGGRVVVSTPPRSSLADAEKGSHSTRLHQRFFFFPFWFF